VTDLWNSSGLESRRKLGLILQTEMKVCAHDGLRRCNVLLRHLKCGKEQRENIKIGKEKILQKERLLVVVRMHEGY
jgi:hypothetical protein